MQVDTVREIRTKRKPLGGPERLAFEAPLLLGLGLGNPTLDIGRSNVNPPSLLVPINPTPSSRLRVSVVTILLRSTIWLVMRPAAVRAASGQQKAPVIGRGLPLVFASELPVITPIYVSVHFAGRPAPPVYHGICNRSAQLQPPAPPNRPR